MNSSSIAATIRAALLVALIAASQRRLLLAAKRPGPAGADVQARADRPRDRQAVDTPRPAHAARGGCRHTRIRDPRPGLPDNGSYRSYADVAAPYVVWNVFAAPEFSVDPKEWCYPIVGCVAYRGYFVERRARRFAAKLRRQGLDVSGRWRRRLFDPRVISMIPFSTPCSAGTTSSWPRSSFTS